MKPNFNKYNQSYKGKILNVVNIDRFYGGFEMYNDNDFEIDFWSIDSPGKLGVFTGYYTAEDNDATAFEVIPTIDILMDGRKATRFLYLPNQNEGLEIINQKTSEIEKTSTITNIALFGGAAALLFLILKK